MIKNSMLTSLMLMSMSTYPMQSIISRTFDAIRYASMAYHPWSAAKSTIAINKISPKERQRAFDHDDFKVADENTTHYIHELIGDSNVRIIIIPFIDGYADASAARELFSGEKIMYITPALVTAIHKTNVPLSPSAFKASVYVIGNNLRPSVEEGHRSLELYNKFLNQSRQLKLDSQTQAEVNATIRHEYRHIENWDQHRTLAYQMLTPLGLVGFDKILQSIGALLLPSLKNKIPFLLRKSLITGIGAYCYFKATPYVLAALAREKERQADTAIIMSDDETLNGGLHSFQKVLFLEGLHGLVKDTWLETHPPTSFRITRCLNELTKREKQKI